MYEQETDGRGYLVYRNRYNGREEQDNPNLLLILLTINEKHSASRYSTYRCAGKLYDLQKALHTSTIPFELVCSILDRHQLNLIDSAPSVKPAPLTAAIHDIYFAAARMGYFDELTTTPNPSTATALLASFLWAVFDPRRMTPISVLELRQTFLLLCDHPHHTQLVLEHFRLASDHNLCVSRHRFETMLGVLSKLLAYLGEPEHLRPTMVQQITAECFASYPGLVGLTEYQFSCLWKLSSLFSYYSNVVSLCRRFRDTEGVVHSGAPCTGCHFAIRGLRFQCQRCRGVSLCTDCFTAGYSDKRHNVSHKMYEISGAERDASRCTAWFGAVWRWFTHHGTVKRDPATSVPSTFDHIDAKLIDTKAVELMGSASPPNESTGGQLPTDASMAGLLLMGRSMSRNRSSTMRRNVSGFIVSNCGDEMAERRQLMLKLSNVTEALEEQHKLGSKQLSEWKDSLGEEEPRRSDEMCAFVDKHLQQLNEHLIQLRRIHSQLVEWGERIGAAGGAPQSSSTPYRSATSSMETRPDGDTAGSKIDTTRPVCAEARESDRGPTSAGRLNKTDFSVRDISAWFHADQPTSPTANRDMEQQQLEGDRSTAFNRTDNERSRRLVERLRLDTDLVNFRELLLKVREIVDDSYSDNAELAHTTQQFERALDQIIAQEELKRSKQSAGDCAAL
ncbi:dystrobrevin alpha-like [Anopheles albimanus]|uniref:dystrobrevin alpha-like n=1 Tax=Anopheles albimanus TaxID=7167 RepID=UPI00163FB45D|nr:dystrobrevin alpha-like [Anopheles albimanus]